MVVKRVRVGTSNMRYLAILRVYPVVDVRLLNAQVIHLETFVNISSRLYMYV